MRMPASFAAPWGLYGLPAAGSLALQDPPLGLGTMSLLLWALGGCAVRSEGRAGPQAGLSPQDRKPGVGEVLEHHGDSLGVLFQGLGPPYTLTRVPGAQAKQRHWSPRARQPTRWKSWTRGGVALPLVLPAGPGGALG